MRRTSTDRVCPLCRTCEGQPFFQDQRDYYQCPTCGLVFVLSDQFLSPEAEKAVYDQHENASDDPDYRRFLDRLCTPMLQRVVPNRCGLDFGSGPGPTLSVMFQEAGHSMEVFDPFYAPDLEPLRQKYDFITASEVVEHLQNPRRDLERIWACLKPHGTLGIMTKRVVDQEAFSRWHYKNDPTHVCFYSIETFRWLAEHWHATLTVPGSDVVLFGREE